MGKEWTILEKKKLGQSVGDWGERKREKKNSPENEDGK